MTNLLKRSISGTIFLIFTVLCYFCSYGYSLLMLLVTVLASAELFRLLAPGRYLREKICITAACAAVFLLGFAHFEFGLDSRFILAGLLPLTAVYVMMLFDCCKDMDFNAALFMPLVYVCLPVCASLFLAFPGGEFTWKIMLGMSIMIWCNDVGAYCCGILLGQRPGSAKLFPAISPKKSWVGAIGGAVCTLLACWAVSATFGSPLIPLVHWFVLGLIVSTVGVCGDLFESLLKRHAGVKDSGNIIPGHGGILDRYDDVLVLMPVFAIYLKLFDLI